VVDDSDIKAFGAIKWTQAIYEVKEAQKERKRSSHRDLEIEERRQNGESNGPTGIEGEGVVQTPGTPGTLT
jgi:hypothetical protein